MKAHTRVSYVGTQITDGWNVAAVSPPDAPCAALQPTAPSNVPSGMCQTTGRTAHRRLHATWLSHPLTCVRESVTIE